MIKDQIVSIWSDFYILEENRGANENCAMIIKEQISWKCYECEEKTNEINSKTGCMLLVFPLQELKLDSKNSFYLLFY